MKSYIKLLAIGVLAISLTGCGKNQEINNSPKQTETANQKQNDTELKHQGVVEEVYKYNGEKLTTKRYIIDDEILDRSVIETQDMFYTDGEENTEIVVEQTEDEQILNIKTTKLPEKLSEPIYATRDNNNIIILNQTKPDVQNDIYIWNIDNDDLSKLDLEVKDGMNIISYVVNNGQIYWMQSDCNYEYKNPSWCINAYNIDTKESIQIDTSDDYDRSTLLPILTANNNRVAYIVGEEAKEIYNHYVVVYDRETNEKQNIFNIENVVTPYMQVFLEDDIVAVPEYFEDGWKLLIYDMNKQTLRREKMEFVTEGEYPREFWFQNDHIIYSSQLSILYSRDINSDEMNIVANGGVKGKVYDGKCIYSNSGSIEVYDIDSNTTEVLYEAEIGKDFYFGGVSLDNNIFNATEYNSGDNELPYYIEFELK